MDKRTVDELSKTVFVVWGYGIWDMGYGRPWTGHPEDAFECLRRWRRGGGREGMGAGSTQHRAAADRVDSLGILAKVTLRVGLTDDRIPGEVLERPRGQ